jgi:hypothetical protein
MIGIRKAGFPWWFFLCMACLWSIVLVKAEPLYDWGIRIRRRLGMVRVADWGERMKPRVLPPSRLALLIMAVISLVVGLL